MFGVLTAKHDTFANAEAFVEFVAAKVELCWRQYRPLDIVPQGFVARLNIALKRLCGSCHARFGEEDGIVWQVVKKRRQFVKKQR